MRRRAQAVFATLVLMFLFSIHPISLAEDPFSETWTFMVYSCADCDLESYQLGYMTQMASVGSTIHVDIVVQMDRISGYSSAYGDWTDCKRFYMTEGLTPASENAIASLGEVNMGDPATLASFLVWAVQEYPSDRYFLMMIGHGWLDGVCPDLTNHDMLTPLEIRWALSQVKTTTGVHVDVIGFEACQQAALEIAYEIGDSADLVVSSEEVSTHWQYRFILSDLVNANGTMDASALASMIVDYYAQYSWATGGTITTLSTFNLSRVKTEVAAAASALADHLIANITWYAHAVADAAARAESHAPLYSIEEAASCRDLYDFALEVVKGISDPPIQAAAQNLRNAIENACIAEWHGTGHPDFHGLYIYLPHSEEVYDARIRIFGQPYTTAHPLWAQDTSWDDLLFSLFNKYALGLRSREQIVHCSSAAFDSNNDDYLDGLQVTLNVSTDGKPIDVTARGFLIDPYGDVVDQCNYTWTVSSAGGLGDIYLYMPSSGAEGLYSVKVTIYDAHGVFEDEVVLSQVAYFPEEMQHAVSARELTLAKTVVGQGYGVEMEVTVVNEGHYPESLTASVYVNETLVDATQTPIPAGGSAIYVVHWDTASQELGNYTVRLFVEPVDGEVNTTDNFLQCDRTVCVSLPGDVDADRDVDIFDIVRLAETYGTVEGHPLYIGNCDINGDGDIDIFDIVLAASHYGENW
jgi:hypothetical protein